MKLLIDQRSSEIVDEANVIVTGSYIELEMECNSKKSLYVYIIPLTSHSAYVGMCFGELYDWYYQVDEEELVQYARKHPKFLELINNGINDQYENGALIQLEDQDEGDNRWFVASIADGISFESEEELFTDLMSDTVILVMDQAYALFSELYHHS